MDNRDWFDEVTDRVDVRWTAWTFIAVLLFYIAIIAAWWLP
jgi:hypothetical protein